MLTQDASPKTSTARKTAGRIAARKRSACQWEWPRGRAMAAGRLAQQGVKPRTRYASITH